MIPLDRTLARILQRFFGLFLPIILPKIPETELDGIQGAVIESRT